MKILLEESPMNRLPLATIRFSPDEISHFLKVIDRAYEAMQATGCEPDYIESLFNVEQLTQEVPT